MPLWTRPIPYALGFSLFLGLTPFTWAADAEVMAPEDAHFNGNSPIDGAAIVIESDPEPESASELFLDAQDLELLPTRSTDDMLKAMPGMHVSLHGGRGKAFQYFLRGFDAVHGADIAVTLEGVPLNEVSNIHGNGYLDLHFLPTDLIGGVRLTPGIWRAEDGNFAVAGSADLQVGPATKGHQVGLALGSDLSLAAHAAWRPETNGAHFAIAEIEGGQGVGARRAYTQMRAAVGTGARLGQAQWRAMLIAYDGQFESPGVLRVKDVESGEMDILGAYKSHQGGESQRVLAFTDWIKSEGERVFKALAWVSWRDLALAQNYTGYYYNPEEGDGTLQSHQNLEMGSRFSSHWRLSPTLHLQNGLDFSAHAIQQSESAIDTAGQIYAAHFYARGRQAHGGAFSSLLWQSHPNLSIEGGLRFDAFILQVLGDDDLHATETEDALAWAPVIAPRMHMAYTPDAPLSAFFSYGRGMRSPELRGAAQGGKILPTTTDSVEIGLTRPLVGDLEIHLIAFGTHVSRELIFDPSAARFIPGGKTRRLGIQGGFRWQDARGFEAALDITAVDGRYILTGETIPYAPRILGVFTGGHRRQLKAIGADATLGLRLWSLGRRPLTGGFYSTPATIGDLTASLERGPWSLQMDITNLLNREWRDGEFYYPSQWDENGPRSDLNMHHFTAGDPRVIRLLLERRI